MMLKSSLVNGSTRLSGQTARSAVPVTRTASANYSGASTSSPRPGVGTDTSSSRTNTATFNQQRANQLLELIRETGQIAVSTGPAGFQRALQGASAVASLTQQYLQTGTIDAPQVVLRKLFERLGATYIKLGQFIASSPSLFPDEYVLEFQKCLDKTDPVPFSVIKKIIEQDMGKPWTDVFESIEEQALASASVAQVHSAVLKGSRKKVVIKVLKPGTREVLTTDMSFVYLVSRYLEFIQPDLSRLSLTGIIGDIRASIIDEVDFTKEAQHLQAFSNFLDAGNLRNVATCPFVYRQFSSERVLVMERLMGVPLTDYAAIRSVTSRDPELVLIGALNTWFSSVIGCETFHADVHAGNLLVLPNGTVGFIDFGIVGSISPVTWKGVEALVASMALADYETMARALATIGACDVDVDFQAFSRDLEAFFAELEQVNPVIVAGERSGARVAAIEVDQTQVNRLFLNLVRIGEKHGIKFPREFGLFLKQILYFDRYTRVLAPSLQVFNDDRINIKNLSQQYGV